MLASGEAYGKYELVEKIAVGGMAEVFRAISTSIGGFRKPVALKRILPHLSTDAEFVSLFIDEAKLTVSLTHGNIVQVFDFGRIDNNYFMAMELVEGRDLTQILIRQSARGRPMPPEVALYVIIGVLRGLGHAHGRKDTGGQPLGIVHRDVSPHNVLVSFEGEVKLADFGIATAAAQVSLTRPGMRLGKFAYMSPEQAREKHVDHRTDLWSAGVTLFECLTGRRLFYHEDPSVTLARVRAPVVPLPSSIASHLGPSLDGLVTMALQASPQHRPRSARAYAAELQAELQRIAPGFDDSDLIRYLRDLFADEVGEGRFPEIDAPVGPVARPRLDTRADSHLSTAFERASARPVRENESEAVQRLQASFQHSPNLWTVADLGAHLQSLGRDKEATLAFRVGAAKFAQVGLRAQAVNLYVRVRDAEGWTPGLQADVQALPQLEGASNRAIAKRLPPLDQSSIGQFLADVLSFAEARPGPHGTGLFDALDGTELSRLSAALDRTLAQPGEAIIREGELGTRLYAIARGRVLIHCTGFRGIRIYLSSLSDGDGFGELSFFTDEPRAATVEALDTVELLSVERSRLHAVQARFPRLTRAMHRFHRSRRTSTLLAKTEVFASLRTADRMWLAERLVSIRKAAGELILREGESDAELYVIADGEVEVFRGHGELFLDKLRRGDVFGEGAALDPRPRTASVRALGPVELLRLSRPDFDALCVRSPQVRAVLQVQARRRDAETMRRLTDGGLST